MTNPVPRHWVAVIGGAVAGAVVAEHLAERNIRVAVFEMNQRPYGKIEDGLPRWHERQRKKEYAAITRRLGHPLIDFVPNTKIGRDLKFAELVNEWGFSCVVLANGAWRDRALPVEGADAYVDKGLIYQNPFVIGFNHANDARYSGPSYDILDDSIVVGGGLASIDVAKIHTLDATVTKLTERGIKVSIEELEVAGIPKTLRAHDLAWEDLGLAGCCIYYRRRIEDMPLLSLPEGARPERILKAGRGSSRSARAIAAWFALSLSP